MQSVQEQSKQETRQSVLEVLADPRNDELRRDELAEKVGISERWLYYILTDKTIWDEARELRTAARIEGLCKLDTAMFDKGIREGDVPAARLMYQRWDGLDDKKGAVIHQTNYVVNVLEVVTVNLLEELSRELGSPERAHSVLTRALSACPDLPQIGSVVERENGDNQDVGPMSGE